MGVVVNNHIILFISECSIHMVTVFGEKGSHASFLDVEIIAHTYTTTLPNK